MTTRVAIHQPNYLPWLGYFYKLARSNVFIFLDNIQFSRGSYTNRVRIKMNDGDQHWLTQSITAGSGMRINNLVLSDEDWVRKHLAALHTNYSRAAYWKEYAGRIQEAYSRSSRSLVDTNIELILWLSRELGLKRETVRASELGVNEENPTRRLVELVRRAGGSVYIFGKGGEDYQETEMFRAAGIGIERSGFEHPVYRQLWGGSFLAGLSAIDMLLNASPAALNYFRGVVATPV